MGKVLPSTEVNARFVLFPFCFYYFDAVEEDYHITSFNISLENISTEDQSNTFAPNQFASSNTQRGLFYLIGTYINC